MTCDAAPCAPRLTRARSANKASPSLQDRQPFSIKITSIPSTLCLQACLDHQIRHHSQRPSIDITDLRYAITYPKVAMYGQHYQRGYAPSDGHIDTHILQNRRDLRSNNHLGFSASDSSTAAQQIASGAFDRTHQILGETEQQKVRLPSFVLPIRERVFNLESVVESREPRSGHSSGSKAQISALRRSSGSHFTASI